jgi:hypothetical protein
MMIRYHHSSSDGCYWKAEELKHALSSGTLPQLGRFAEEGAQRDVNRSTSMSITFLTLAIFFGIILLSLHESGSRRKEGSVFHERSSLYWRCLLVALVSDKENMIKMLFRSDSRSATNCETAETYKTNDQVAVRRCRANLWRHRYTLRLVRCFASS